MFTAIKRLSNIGLTRSSRSHLIGSKYYPKAANACPLTLVQPSTAIREGAPFLQQIYDRNATRRFASATEDKSGLAPSTYIWVALSMAAGTALGYFLFSKNNGDDKKPKEFVASLKKNGNEHLPIEEAQLTFAPDVPPPITRKHPAKLKVFMTTEVVEIDIDPSHKYVAWTFSGKVPGPFVRARVGDVLEYTLQNKDVDNMHNMDFHGVTGPGGGAGVTTAEAPESKTAEFKLLYPGLFMYHCAVDPVNVHIANGMYGLLLVEPEEGLPPVDKEFYILQSEFYATPVDDNPRLLELDYDRAMSEDPTHVLLNGSDGALREEGTLKVNVGDRVRIFYGNAGPNLPSSFHVIGAIMDKVYREGDLITAPARGLQTTHVPAGGAAALEIDFPVPGTFTMLDHSIWRIDKGCVGFISVEGETRPDLFYAAGNPLTCKNCKIHP